MKTIIKFVILLSALLFATQCLAQFGNTNGTKFPYTNGVSRNDMFLIGTPGVTNKNIASSNLLNALAAVTTPTFNLTGNASTSTISTNTPLGYAIASAATNGAVMYVRTNGVDATAQLGRQDLPARTLTYAVANTPAGGVINLGVGDWQESNLNFTNLSVVGEDQSRSSLVFTNGGYGYRTWGTVYLDNLTIRPNYTNSALTYPIVQRSGSLLVGNIRALCQGASDIFFPNPVDVTESIYCEVDGAYLETGWDAFNLVVSGTGSTLLLKNLTVLVSTNTAFGQANRFIATISGHNVYIIGCKITVQTGTENGAVLSGSDLSNVHIVGSSFWSDGKFTYSSGYFGSTFTMSGSDVYAATLPTNYASAPFRPLSAAFTSPWYNAINAYATNTSLAYRGQTIAVTGAGSTAVNGLYVRAGISAYVDQNWGRAQVIYTNTANNRLKFVIADTNSVDNLYTYQLYTNNNASVSAPSTSWSLNYQSLDGITWETVNGANPAPTAATNLSPSLTLNIDGKTRINQDSTEGVPLTINDTTATTDGNVVFKVDAVGSTMFVITDEGNLTNGLIHSGTISAQNVISRPGGQFSGNGAGITNLSADNIASGTVPTARLGSGTANSSSFLRGDQTWAAVSGSLPADPSVNSVLTNKNGGPSGWFPIASLPAGSGGTNLWMQKDGSNWTNALNADIIWSSASPTSQELKLGDNDYINNGAQRWRASPGLEVGTGTYAIQGSGTSGGLSEGDGSMRVWHTVSNYVSGGVNANKFYGDGSSLTGLTAGQIGPSAAVSNGQASVTFGTLSATTLNITTANVTNMVSAGAATNGYLFANSNGVVVATRNIVATNVIASNATPSRIAFFGPDNGLTNASATSAATPINRDGTASTAAQIGGMFSGGSTYLKADGTTGTGGGSGGGGISYLFAATSGWVGLPANTEQLLLPGSSEWALNTGDDSFRNVPIFGQGTVTNFYIAIHYNAAANGNMVCYVKTNDLRSPVTATITGASASGAHYATSGSLSCSLAGVTNISVSVSNTSASANDNIRIRYSFQIVQ